MRPLAARDPGGHLGAWEKRGREIAEWVNRDRIEILGTQEGVGSMFPTLKKGLSRHYKMETGKPTVDDKYSGDKDAVFFDSKKFGKLRSGTFWLSETPDEPSSYGWDTTLPRVRAHGW